MSKLNIDIMSLFVAERIDKLASKHLKFKTLARQTCVSNTSHY